jgi:hypothetical protein
MPGTVNQNGRMHLTQINALFELPKNRVLLLTKKKAVLSRLLRLATLVWVRILMTDRNLRNFTPETVAPKAFGVRGCVICG